VDYNDCDRLYPISMAQPYSNDFRQKVMPAIELDSLKKSEASQLFNISRNTINLWFQRKAETGDVKPKPRQASQQNGFDQGLGEVSRLSQSVWG
jgi:hypothetical protein